MLKKNTVVQYFYGSVLYLEATKAKRHEKRIADKNTIDCVQNVRIVRLLQSMYPVYDKEWKKELIYK